MGDDSEVCLDCKVPQDTITVPARQSLALNVSPASQTLTCVTLRSSFRSWASFSLWGKEFLIQVLKWEGMWRMIGMGDLLSSPPGTAHPRHG